MRVISLCSACQDKSIDMDIELRRSIIGLGVTNQLICILNVFGRQLTLRSRDWGQALTLTFRGSRTYASIRLDVRNTATFDLLRQRSSFRNHMRKIYVSLRSSAWTQRSTVEPRCWKLIQSASSSHERHARFFSRKSKSSPERLGTSNRSPPKH